MRRLSYRDDVILARKTSQILKSSSTRRVSKVQNATLTRKGKPKPACAYVNGMKLVNPKTGERITCRAVVLVDQFHRENCVKEYEGIGFVQAQNLTPEQRDNLPPKPAR
jgi:hypothetical protein